MKSLFNKIILIVSSILFALLFAFVLDRTVGRFLPRPYPEGTHDLIFPPLSHQEFVSVDFEYVVETNSLGLRDREITFPKPQDVFRIVAIGDSYTYGWGVNIEDTWLRRLETLVQIGGRRIETVNVGKPGAGPPWYAEIARTVVPLLEPDLILVGILQGNDIASAGSEGLEWARSGIVQWTRYFYPNFVHLVEQLRLSRAIENRTQERPPEKTTAEDNRRWAENTAKEFYQKMSPEEKQRFEMLDDRVQNAFLTGLLNPYMIDLALKNKHIYTLTLNPEDPWIRQCIENMATALKIIRHISEGIGARSAVVAIPDGPYVNESAWKNIQKVGFDATPEMLTSNAPDQVIQEACKLAGIHIFVVSKAFRDQRSRSDLFFPLDGHLTPEGHRLLAETLAPMLQSWLTEGR